MDIRIRLLLITAPFIALLLAFLLAVPFIQGRITMVVVEQRTALDEIITNQQLILAILRENDIVGRITNGDPRALAELRSNRIQIDTGLEAQERPDADIALDRALADRYGQLAAYHDVVVETMQTGNISKARASYRDPEITAAIEGILNISASIQDQNIGNLSAATEAARQTQGAIALVIGLGLLLGVLSAIALAILVMQQIARPLNRLTVDAERFADGTTGGQLSAMPPITQLQRLRDSFQRMLDVTIKRQHQLEESLHSAEQQVEREQQLRSTIQSLSVPVVPLREDTLFLPLVGYLDSQRTSAVSATLLNAIEQRRARTVVIDLTGLANLDDQTAHGLRTIAEAANLLGARLTIVGVRPDQALALSQSGLGRRVAIARDIPAALNS